MRLATRTVAPWTRSRPGTINRSTSSLKSILPPGFTIGALAVASGTGFVDAALGVATVLGGIAGPMAAIDGPAGDLIHPGLNLVVAGRDHAPWRRLEELLLGPVDACQRTMRDLSHAATQERLDHLQFSSLRDGTNAVAERSKAGLFRVPNAPATYVDEHRHLAVLRTPSFFLRAPDGQTLGKAVPEIMDANALLVYEDLFSGVGKGTAKDKYPLGPRLAVAVGGHDEFNARDKQIGPGSLDAFRAHLLVTTTRDEISEVVTSGNDDAQTILRHSVLLEPATTAVVNVNRQDVRWGYQAYYRAVKYVLDARRTGDGAQIEPKREALDALHAFTVELQLWCQGLPARLQPYFAKTLSLPYRLHWAFVATLAPREDDKWVLPFTLVATRQILERQRRLLDDILTDAATVEHRRARVTMMWKLAAKPLSMRDLVRRFRVQKVEVHEPVVSELIGENLVTRHPDGLLELTTQGRTYLAA